MTLEERYKKYIQEEIKYQYKDISSQDVAMYTLNLNSMFEVSSKLYSPKEETEDLKNLQAKYVFSGEEFNDALNGFKEITTTELKSLQKKIENMIESSYEAEKTILLKSYEDIKEQLKTKSVEMLFSDKALEEMPVQLQEEFQEILKQQGKTIIEATDQELESFFEAAMSKYNFFVNNYIKQMKKYAEEVITSNTYKVIATLSSNINSSENKEKLNILLKNMKVIEKIEKESSEVKKLKLMDGLQSLSDKASPSDKYIETIQAKEYFLSAFHTLESFKDISESITKKNRLNKLLNPAKKIQTATEILADIASKTISDLIVTSKTGLETSTTYLYRRATVDNRTMEERINEKVFYVNEENKEKNIAVATFVEETSNKITQRSLKATRKENYLKPFQALKTHTIAWVKHLSKIIPSLEKEKEELEEAINSNIESYTEAIKKSQGEFDFSKRVSDRYEEEIQKAEDIKDGVQEKIEEYIGSLEEAELKIRKEAQTIKDNISEMRDLAVEHMSKMEENLQLLQRTYQESRNLNLTESEIRDIKIKIKSLSDNILKIKSNIQKLSEDIQNIEIEARASIKRITEIAGNIKTKATDLKEDVTESYEEVKDLISGYKEEIDDILSMDLNNLKSRYFSDTAYLLEKTKEDIESIKDLPQVVLNKTQKLIGYDKYKKIVKSLKGMKSISTKLKEEEKVKEYFETVQDMTVDYGYHDDLEAYEIELYKIGEMKLEAYKKVYKLINNDDINKQFTNTLEVNKIVHNLAKELLLKFPNKEIETIYIEILNELEKSSETKAYIYKEKSTLQKLGTHSSDKYINLLSSKEDTNLKKEYDVSKLFALESYIPKKEEQGFFKKTFTKLFNREDKFLNLNPFGEKDESKRDIQGEYNVLLHELSSYRVGVSYRENDVYGFKGIAKATTLILDELQAPDDELIEIIEEAKNILNNTTNDQLTKDEIIIRDILNQGEMNFQTKKRIIDSIEDMYSFRSNENISPEVKKLVTFIESGIDNQERNLNKSIRLIQNNIKELKETKQLISYAIERNTDKFLPTYTSEITQLDLMINEHLSFFKQLKRLHNIDENNDIENHLIQDTKEGNVQDLLENMIQRIPIKITDEELLSTIEEQKVDKKILPELNDEEILDLIEAKLLASNTTTDNILINTDEKDSKSDVYNSQIYLEDMLYDIVLDTKRSKVDEEARIYFNEDIEEVTKNIYKSLYKVDVVSINKEIWEHTEKLISENDSLAKSILSSKKNISLYIKNEEEYMSMIENDTKKQYTSDEKNIISDIIDGMRIQQLLANLSTDTVNNTDIEEKLTKLYNLSTTYNPIVSKELKSFAPKHKEIIESIKKSPNGLKEFHTFFDNQESDTTEHYNFRNNLLKAVYSYSHNENSDAIVLNIFKIFKEKMREINQDNSLLQIKPVAQELIKNIGNEEIKKEKRNQITM